MVTKTTTGFTLIELIVTVFVLSMVLVLGVPGFQNSVRNSYMTTATNDLVTAFQLARSEAVKRRTPVVLCVTDNSSDENDADCNPDKSWTDGWLAFVDNDGDNALGENDDIVLRHPPVTERGSVRVLLATEGELADRIVYDPSGFPRPYADGSTGGFILLCDDRNDNNFARLINISQTGRPMVTSIERLPDEIDLFCQADT